MSEAHSYRAPLNTPPGPDDTLDELTTKITSLRYQADHVMDAPVIGPRRQSLTVSSAQDHGQTLAAAIETEEALGSHRHRLVGGLTKALVLLVVVIVDFPIMLWLASSVFNVNWDQPLGLPMAISVVVSLLATGGAAAALYHLGHDLRQHKNHRRHLDKQALTIGSKITLAGVAILIVLIAGVAFYRVYTEGVLSGAGDLALLLAILVAVVMLISSWLVFWIAFRDGSPEQDDLAHYTRIVNHHLALKRGYEETVNQLEHQVQLIRRRSNRGAGTRVYPEVAGPAHGLNGRSPSRSPARRGTGGAGLPEN